MADHYFPLVITIWREDTKLLSFAARGFWLELLLTMHQSPEYGRLIVGDVRISADDVTGIARLLRSNWNQSKSLLSELSSRGLFSVADDGTMYCRRMVRYEEKRQRLRDIGSLGGNPALKKASVPSESPPPRNGVAAASANGSAPTSPAKPKRKPRTPKDTKPLDVTQQPTLLTTTEPSVNVSGTVQEAVAIDPQIDTEAPLDDDAIALPPSQFDVVPIGMTTFMKWFVAEGVGAGVIDEHHAMMPIEYARDRNGITFATNLLSKYGEARCKEKSLALFAEVKTSKNGHRNPRLKWLWDRWEHLGSVGKVKPPINAFETAMRNYEERERMNKLAEGSA